MAKSKKSTKSNSKKSIKSNQKTKNHVIDLGKLHCHLQLEDEIKKLHNLTGQEIKLLVEDFRRIKKVEKEEEAELMAVKHFEKKLQELLGNIVYLDGYIKQIEDGQSMLRINPSVKALGTQLVTNIEELEKLSESMLSEEKKILHLAKNVKQLLSRAKKYQTIIFG